MSHFILAIDQGTTSTRAVVFDGEGRACGQAQRRLRQSYPHPGWVEHDPEEIWEAVLDLSRQAIVAAKVTATAITGIGITNQRETTVIWDRGSGRAIAPAIVWQDRRTAERCAAIARDGHGPLVTARTGLLLDPYFSATKIAWLLDTVPGARNAAAHGELAFGTIDSFLLWRLTEGAVHATDATNASRTMLFDIHRQDWDEDLLAIFGVPRTLLPEVRDSAGTFGATDPAHFGVAIPVTGIADDQQAATIGQACFQPGMIKSTYGTGCFAVLNTGAVPIPSQHRLLTTVAYRIAGRATYAVEGSIFSAGAAVQWLRDGLGIIASAGDCEGLARTADPTRRVYLVPAFTGLGAPHWDAAARGALIGLTLDTGRADIVRAALEAACFQTRDLIEAMAADGTAPRTLRIDGGMVVNDWFVQCLADTLGLPVDRPADTETTVLGAASLAGLGAGLYPSLSALEARRRRDRMFEPMIGADERNAAYAGWQEAVARIRSVE